MCLWKDIDLIHMLDPNQYKFLFLFTTLVDPEPGAGAETSIFRLWPKVPAPQHCLVGTAMPVFHNF